VRKRLQSTCEAAAAMDELWWPVWKRVAVARGGPPVATVRVPLQWHPGASCGTAAAVVRAAAQGQPPVSQGSQYIDGVVTKQSRDSSANAW
jgi:hypothetical protein